MIIEHDEQGRIFHIISDPVMPEVLEAYLARGALSFEPKPGAPIQARTMQGEAIVDEDGNPVMTNGSSILAKCDIQSDYIRDGQITPRPLCPATVVVSGRRITIKDAPKGSTFAAEIEDVEYPLDDTTVELDEAGPLTIIINPPFPYMEARHDLEIM
ncbi:hypothetical protein [Manganibacter manganicus]|uniref:Uncharacterized protein n=1 Tax=Manganibacter manganicus TaxID=1873176 RepID=A0A1V8RR37_9HYPH|nr:hypothetical protein [Pseudaminobacter manganicus]OQM75603.1 hypothetical protein BFN67_17680 [Pseudaminobacter manganicus]